MARIFVSYGRHEATSVARRLADALEEGSRHEVWLDRDDIAYGERFMSVILPAIDACEAFVFLAGPVSIASVWCQREIEHAIAARKKLIPIQLGPGPHPLPAGIDGLNMIPGPTPGDEASFEALVQAVADAIARDHDWHRAHAALLVQATRWLDDGRHGSRLTGAALRAALDMVAAADAGKQPGLTTLQREFVGDCQRLELEEAERLRVAHARGVARQLGARALLLAQGDPGALDTAALLAAESVERLPTLEALRLLHQALRLLPRVRLRHHVEGGVRGLAFSEDGLLLAAAGEDGVAYVWSDTGELRVRVEHGSGPVLAVTLPDGHAVVSVGADRTIRRTAIPSGRLEDQRQAARRGDMALADRAPVVVEASGSDVLVHRIDDARSAPLRFKHDDRVASVWVSARGAYVAALTSPPLLPRSDGRRDTLSIWRTGTAERVDLDTGFVSEAVFSPDERSIAVVTVGTGTTVWSSAGERAFEAGGQHPTFSSDGRWLATALHRTGADGARRGSVQVVSAKDGRVVQTLGTDQASNALLLWPNAVVGAGDGRALRIWDARRGSEVGRAIAGAPIRRIAGSRDARLVATADERGEVRLHALAARLEDQTTSYVDIVNTVVTSDDGRWEARAIGGRRLVSATSGPRSAGHVRGANATIDGGLDDLVVALDGTIAARVQRRTAFRAGHSGEVGWHGLVVAVPNGEPLLLRRDRPVTAYALAPDGGLVADADETSEIRITDTRDGRQLASLHAEAPLSDLAFERAGTLLAFRAKGSIGIANPRDPSTLRSLAAAEPRALALSKDGSRLAVASGADRLTVYAADTFAEMATTTVGGSARQLRFLDRRDELLLEGREWLELYRCPDLSPIRRLSLDQLIVECQIDPEERYLAARGERLLRAWRLEDGLPLAELPTGPGTSVAFDSAGWLLVANDTRVDRFPLSPDAVVTTVRERVGRALTPVEWTAAVPDEPYPDPAK